MPKEKISRNDIARLAGVSGATVSYALSEKDAGRIKKATRDTIVKLANELGYKPSFSGKTLSTGKSYNVALSLPSAKTLGSQHVMAIIQGISRAAAETEYNLTLFFATEVEKHARSIASGRVDGLIVLRDALDPRLEKITREIPVVIVDGADDLAESEKVAQVRSNHETMIRDALDYFSARSRTNVLAVLGDPRSSPVASRAFSAECAARAENLFGAVLIPGRNFSAQAKRVSQTGQRWDAFIVDNECLSNLLIAELETVGQREGEDFDMIVYSIANQRFSCDAYRDSVKCRLLYIEQETAVGEAAWAAFADLSRGGDGPRRRLVPYRLWEKPEKPLPCHWNSEA